MSGLSLVVLVVFASAVASAESQCLESLMKDTLGAVKNVQNRMSHVESQLSSLEATVASTCGTGSTVSTSSPDTSSPSATGPPSTSVPAAPCSSATSTPASTSSAITSTPAWTTPGGPSAPKDCSGLNDGIHKLYVPGVGALRAKCSSGYTTFEIRQDGNTSFDRGLAEYLTGFGEPSQDHWLGLRALHALTSGRQCRFRAELQLDLGSKQNEYGFNRYPTDSDAYPRYIECNHFRVGPSDGYNYTMINCSSDIKHPSFISSSLLRGNGRDFSTKDRDRDSNSVNCAKSSGYNPNGAWWYHSSGCGNFYPHSTKTNPNSNYCSADNHLCINWGAYYIRSQEFKLRC